MTQMRPSDLAYGFFTPGTIIRDSQGNRWLCYLHWVNIAEDIGWEAGTKARFISFEDIVSNKCWTTNPMTTMLHMVAFAKNPCPRKRGSQNLPYCLWQPLPSKRSMPRMIETRKSGREHGREPAQTCSSYVAIQLFGSGKSVGKARIDAINFLYEPDSGRIAGTQPYMRYIMDGTHVGTNRADLPQEKYWMHHFFKKTSDKSRTSDHSTSLTSTKT